VDKTNRFKNNTVSVLLVISIALTVFNSYHDILSYFFTGLDSFNLIEEGRFNSFRDFLRLFMRPMTQEFAWYRPLAEFSYGLDYAIWGLNPFGFQLTQLLLHISASIFIFFFARFMLNGQPFIAWLSALIFAVHPIHVEVIPVTARRNDMIITLFLLPSLMLFIKYFSSGFKKNGYLIFSLSFYALALLTKEIGVILPVLIFFYMVIFSWSDKRSLVNMLTEAIKKCIPYAVVTVIYLVWRAHIVGGIGGYASPSGRSNSVINIVRSLYNICLSYLQDLIYPVDFLRLESIFSPFPTLPKQAIFMSTLFLLFLSLFIFRETILKIIIGKDSKITRILRMLLAITVILSLVSILVYPIVSPYINHVIRQSYNGKGPLFFYRAMENIGTYPVEIYFYKARDIMLRLSLFLLLSSGLFLAVLYKWKKIQEFFLISAQGRLIGFLLIWMLVPLAVYLATVTFDHHDMYISVIPFSLLLSIIFFKSFHSAAQKIKEKISFFNPKIIQFMTIVFLIISLFAYSPLARTYGEWEASGKISKMFLDKLATIIPELPKDSVLHIYNFPSSIASYRAEIPHAREVTYYSEATIESWLIMTYPNSRMKVLIESKKELPSYPNNLALEFKQEKDNNVIINILYDLYKDS